MMISHLKGDLTIAFVLSAGLTFGIADGARADLVTEAGDFGNTRATAFSLNGLLSASSNGANDDVYGVGDPTAIIRGSVAGTDDIDFFSFSANGGQRFYFDVDTRGLSSGIGDSFLQLFDDTGTLIATGDDTDNTDGMSLDPGTQGTGESFLGVFTTTGDINLSRNYFLAITDFSSRATQADLLANRTQLVRPVNGTETQFGAGNNMDLSNLAGIGATGDDSFVASGGNVAAGNYTLNVTQQVAPVPEPTTWAMMGMGLSSMLALRRRKRNGSQNQPE